MKAKMQADGSKVRNRGLWRNFFRLVRYAKIPWIGTVIYLCVNLSTVYIAVRLPQVEGDIYSGNASVANIAFVICVELISSLLVSVMLAANGIIGGRIDRNFRNAIWNKILRLEPKYFDDISANTLLSRMTDDAESMKDFILLIISEITGITTTVATITAMSTMNRGLAVIMAVFIPVITVFGFLIGRLKMRFGNNVKFKMAQLTDYLSGQLARITVIKAFNRQDFEGKRGESEIEEYYVAERKIRIIEFTQSTVASLLSMIPSVALILAGIYLIETKELTPAGWIVFYSYANTLMVFFTGKIDTWISVKEYQGRMNRLAELFAAPEEKRDEGGEEVPSGEIVFDDVSFSYGEKDIFSHVSMRIPENQFTAVLGPSGTGKTTVLKLLERIYEPSSGKILLDGREIQDYRMESWRKQMSYVKQDTPMISGTLRDNILYGVEEACTDEQIMESAREVRADEFIRNCPGGLDYEVGQFGEKLSGGQRQKISILRAFLQKREYILLDEPTASLDVVSTHEVIQSVRGLIGKRTIVLVSHDSKLVRDADHIIVIEDDSKVYEGTADELERVSEYFREMSRNTETEGESTGSGNGDVRTDNESSGPGEESTGAGR